MSIVRCDSCDNPVDTDKVEMASVGQFTLCPLCMEDFGLDNEDNPEEEDDE